MERIVRLFLGHWREFVFGLWMAVVAYGLIRLGDHLDRLGDHLEKIRNDVSGIQYEIDYEVSRSTELLDEIKRAVEEIQGDVSTIRIFSR